MTSLGALNARVDVGSIACVAVKKVFDVFRVAKESSPFPSVEPTWRHHLIASLQIPPLIRMLRVHSYKVSRNLPRSNKPS